MKQGSPLGEPAMGGTRSPWADLPALVSSLSPGVGAECPGPLSFSLAAVSHDVLRPADAETITAALQGAGLTADGKQGALVQDGPRIGPGGFSLGFYKSARKTATFTLRCHSQGPTQDQLLADFDSVMEPGQSFPELGHWHAWLLVLSLSLSFFFLASLLIPMQPFPY